jgi:hypothetical protein
MRIWRDWPAAPVDNDGMRNIATVFACATVLAGCGGGGSTATAPTTPTTPPAETQCRNFATKIARTTALAGVPAPVVASCEFGTALLQLTCRASFVDIDGVAAVQTKTWTYGSVADFVNEARVVGMTTSKAFASETLAANGQGRFGFYALIPDRPIQGNNTFAGGKLLASGGMAFSAWDAKLRPTAGAAAPICATDTGHTYAYDDTLRQVTDTYATTTSAFLPGVGRQCLAPVVSTTTFDAQGNVTDTGGIHFDVLETKPVCL